MSHVSSRPLRSSAICAAVIATLLGTCAAGRAAVVVFTVPGSESTTLNPGTPDVSGNNVIWRARQGSGFGIYGRNLSTNTSYTVTASGTVFNDVAIGGNVVTWQDNRSNTFNIYSCNLTTMLETPISLGGTNNSKLSPRTDGQRIVWTDTRSGGSQVYGYNFQTGTESLVADAPNEFASSTLPDVSGNNVVYQSSLAVYVKNTATNTTTRIGGNEALRSAASTTGNYVVYERRPNLSTFGDIYGYDITTGQEFAIATGVASQQNPDVSDRYVVWEDGRTNAPGIYGFDLVTRQEFLIATGNISNPAVDGNLVVWQESFGDGRESIRAAYVPEPAMAGVVMGGAALTLARRRRA